MQRNLLTNFLAGQTEPLWLCVAFTTHLFPWDLGDTGLLTCCAFLGFCKCFPFLGMSLHLFSWYPPVQVARFILMSPLMWIFPENPDRFSLFSVFPNPLFISILYPCVVLLPVPFVQEQCLVLSCIPFHFFLLPTPQHSDWSLGKF